MTQSNGRNHKISPRGLGRKELLSNKSLDQEPCAVRVQRFGTLLADLIARRLLNDLRRQSGNDRR